ncbi:unnamed protein product [Medioppia subpectinata]|uniref:Integrin beta n=1 Tax=Medioppia subpectinata TaxID=1979941 RepID=A0A7R9PYG5_9ACAR|nr:unnamed protein product [Medioppia subpectinata]CAG2105381.1 unnamed protein product [Medioppia subpectinata]
MKRGNFSYHRCDFLHRLSDQGCFDQIFFPSPSFTPLLNEDLSNKTSEDSDPIQLRPQRVHLKIRPNLPYNVHIQFKQALDYPVDLYYLMDLSKSMEDDKEKLAQLGNQLAVNMRKITSNFRLGFGSFVDKVVMPYITSNFRLGFGSFVDKVVMPYVSTVREKLDEPCTGCAAPYGFRNHMKLDTNANEFVRKVGETQISGNLDAPEGGFDAIMQAIVCRNEIGWREKSRKMLVFTTDSGFHYAGDGKLGGIVKPNDGECHLDRSGLYTESTTQDYPSISQINHKVKDHHVNVIFAVTSNQFDIYRQLAEGLNPLIEGSTAGKLENDSSNIVDLIQDEYLKITSAIELKDNATDNVKITYYSSCLNQKKEETKICRGLRVGDSVTFEAKIEVTSCPRNRGEWNQTILIYPVGLNDALIIDLEMICECDCEKPWNEQTYSPYCEHRGTYECGICSCNDNFYGRRCECDAKEANPAEEEQSCIRGNDTKVCSGRGACRCGECECYKREAPEEVTGKFCECDNFSCDRYDGKVCSGPDHGKCECGTCLCNDDWTGPDCSCKKSNEDCVDPRTNKECNGRGKCVCGQCICEPKGDEQYTGQFCEDCPTCKSQCEIYKECVQCRIHQSGPLDEEACNQCNINPIGTSEFEVTDGEQLCVFIDDDDCKFQFKYKYEEKEDLIYVIAQNTKDCPEPVDVLAIVIGVIVGIVLIGLALLLIWKLLTTIHDRREFAKFEKERMMAKWDTGENPIFKQATTTFKNPTYGGKQ